MPEPKIENLDRLIVRLKVQRRSHCTAASEGISAVELFNRAPVHPGRCVVTMTAVPVIVLGFGIMMVYFQRAGLTQERAEALDHASNRLYRPP